VFVVASARDDINPTEILFEFEGVRRDIAPRRETGQEVAGTIAARFGISRNNHEECVPVVGALDTECGGSRLTHQSVDNGHIVAARMVAFGEYSVDGTASAMKARDWKDATDLVAHPIAFPANLSGTQHASAENIAPSMGSSNPLAVAHSQVFENHGTDSRIKPVDVCPTVTSRWGTGGNNVPLSMRQMAVRRLTPTECERLQGFPDNYTNIPWRKAPESPDGPRYKALGNSWAVPVVAWIGQRIQDQIK
jgi:DNA (cytosine-5)-methyltransferase 1